MKKIPQSDSAVYICLEASCLNTSLSDTLPEDSTKKFENIMCMYGWSKYYSCQNACVPIAFTYISAVAIPDK